MVAGRLLRLPLCPNQRREPFVITPARWAWAAWYRQRWESHLRTVEALEGSVMQREDQLQSLGKTPTRRARTPGPHSQRPQKLTPETSPAAVPPTVIVHREEACDQPQALTGHREPKPKKLPAHFGPPRWPERAQQRKEEKETQDENPSRHQWRQRAHQEHLLLGRGSAVTASVPLPPPKVPRLWRGAVAREGVIIE